MSAMEALIVLQSSAESFLTSNWSVLLGTLALGGVLLLLSLHRKKYSYYNAPSPPVRAPYWIFGNVELSER
jgi:hypothetical protein